MPFKLTGGLPDSQFKNNHFTEMCSGSEAGSYLRRIDFVYHSTPGLRVIKKKKKKKPYRTVEYAGFVPLDSEGNVTTS